MASDATSYAVWLRTISDLYRSGRISGVSKSLLKEYFMNKRRGDLPEVPRHTARFCRAIVAAESFKKLVKVYETALTPAALARLQDFANGQESYDFNKKDFDCYTHLLDAARFAHAGASSPVVVYELGSGLGLGAMSACLTQNVSHVVAIEESDARHRIAEELQERFKEECATLWRDGPPLRLIHDDFLTHDWSDADVVLAHSACFDDKTMARLEALACGLSPGAIVLLFARQFSDPMLELLHSEVFELDWGTVSGHVYRRAGDAAAAAATAAHDLSQQQQQHSPRPPTRYRPLPPHPPKHAIGVGGGGGGSEGGGKEGEGGGARRGG